MICRREHKETLKQIHDKVETQPKGDPGNSEILKEVRRRRDIVGSQAS